MMRQLLVATALIAGLIDIVQSACINQPIDAFSQYNVTLCDLDQSINQPITLINQSIPTFTNLDNGFTNRINVSFPIYIYGNRWNDFFIGTNGLLMFGTEGLTVTTREIPIIDSNTQSLPIIAMLWTDLKLDLSLGSISLSEQGLIGSRLLIIRYHRVQVKLAATLYPNSCFVSFDVIFYENVPGKYDIRYFTFDDNPAVFTPYFSVGMQSHDDGGAYWTMWPQYNSNWSSVRDTLYNRQLSFTYIGETVDNVACGGSGYDFSSLRGSLLEWTDSSSVRWVYSPCGPIPSGICATTAATRQASICRVAANVPSDLGVWGVNSQSWKLNSDGSNGLTMLSQSGTYCTALKAQTFASVKYECESTATTAYISAARSIGDCVYTLTVKTSLACSAPTGSDVTYQRSSLTDCDSFTGQAYDGTICPRSDANLAPITLTNPAYILANQGTGLTQRIDLPFDFYFYSQPWRSLFVSTNGALYFSRSSTIAAASSPSFGHFTTDELPVLAAFGAPLTASAYAGMPLSNISYSSETIDGQPAMVIRYKDVRYSAYRGMYDMVLYFDIILRTGERSSVDVRYYQVSPQTQVDGVQIGIHGPGNFSTFTTFSDYQLMTASLARRLTGSTISYSYTGVSASSACMFSMLNMSTVTSSDLVFTDSVNGITMYVNPCGRVTSTRACDSVNNFTSICQVRANGAATGLAAFAPSEMSWSYSPAPVVGLRLAVSSGDYCHAIGQPRQVTIDYVCSKVNLTASVVSITEVSTCIFNIQIATPVACGSSNLCTTINNDLYAGKLCPTVVSRIAMTNPTNVLIGQDDAAVRVALPSRDFFVYGQPESHIWISSNGVVSFGSTGLSAPTGSLPLVGSQLDATPALALWWANLVVSSSSSITYSTETINNKRVFVVRYRDVDYTDSTLDGPNDAISFDFLLYEGIAGQMEVRYYAVNVPTSTHSVTVGLMSDDELNGLILANNEPVTPAFAASFTNATLSLSFTGQSGSAGCAGLGYNLTSLSTSDITLTSAGFTYTLRVCGVVQYSACLNAAEGESSMFCQVSASQSVLSLAAWNPASAYWQYPLTSSGVQLVQQDGAWCSAIQSSRVTILNFICDSSAITATLTAVVEQSPCIFYANVSTNLVCGAGERGSKNSTIPQSSLTECVTTTGDLYDAVMCPRPVTDQYAQPQVQTNPSRVVAGDDEYALVSFDFPFYVYGHQVQRLFISCNGFVSFGYLGSQASSANKSLPDLGFGTNHDFFPMIMPFFSNLINTRSSSSIVDYEGFIAYSFEGSAPNRKMIVRFSDVDYYTTRNSYFAQRSVAFDLVLSESVNGGSGGIEIRYYQVDAGATQNTVVGMRGYGQSYTAVHNNVPITSMLASQLIGTTLTFSYKGLKQYDLCGGSTGLYDFTSLSQSDLTFPINNGQIVFRPCGLVSTNAWLCQAASVCQSTSTQATVLGVDHPISTVYSYPDVNTVRATINEGQFCQSINAPRKTIVDYVCNSDASTAFISSVGEQSTCVTLITVQTSLACVQSTCQTFDGPLYTAQMCNRTNQNFVKTNLTNPRYVLIGDEEESSEQVNIGFDVQLYGQTFRSMWISTCGYLSFGAVQPVFVSGTLPRAASLAGIMPLLAVYNFRYSNTNSNNTAYIAYSVEGVAPNRVLIVRWNEITHYANRPGTDNVETVLSFDARLYENMNGRMDTFYWRTDGWDVAYPTIGTQANDDARSLTTVVNFKRWVQTLPVEGQHISWDYTGSMANATCGAFGFNFSSLSGSDLSYRNESTNTTTYFNPCGSVRASVCSNNTATARSMVCSVSSANATNAASYNSYATEWTRRANGVMMYSPTGSYCSDLTTPSTAYVNFICDSAASTPRLSEVFSTEGGCITRLVVQTALACGAGDGTTSDDNDLLVPTVSTLTACYTVLGSMYNARVCPRNTSSAHWNPVTMTNPVQILQEMDDAAANVQIGFPFSFFGVDTFRQLNISSNGLLQFGEGVSVSGTPTTLSSMPASADNWPILAAGWTNLINKKSAFDVTYVGSIGYSNEGVAPNRKLIIRFDRVDYFNFRYHPRVTGVSYDVVLSEGGGIEVRYYRIDANEEAYMTIGVHNDDVSPTAYTAVQNRAHLTDALAAQLTGSNIHFEYTGLSSGEACGAFGYSLLGATGVDLQWTDNTSGLTYYHRVCGVVDSPVCQSAPVTEHSTLCEARDNIALYSAGTFNPSAVAWSQVEGGIQSYEQTGTFCPTPLNAPRVTSIKYLCSPQATTPVLSSVTVIEQCTYNAIVLTSAVCTLASSSTGSAEVSSSASYASSSASSSTSIAESGSSSSMSDGAIAGAVIGSVIGALILCAALVYVLFKRRGGGGMVGSDKHRQMNEVSVTNERQLQHEPSFSHQDGTTMHEVELSRV